MPGRLHRKAIVELLEDEPSSISDLARRLQVDKGTVEQELRHIERSLKHDARRLVVTPAECRKCGFTFGDDKLLKPGKCPACRSTWIREPRVQVAWSP